MKNAVRITCFGLAVWLLVGWSDSARILAFFPIGGSSHYNVAETLLKELAARGHQVTAVTSLPQKTPLANFRDVDVSGVRPASVNSVPFGYVQTQLQDHYRNFYMIANISRTYCEVAFSQPQVKDLLAPGERFDLVITEIFGADCGVGFAWKFRAPLVSMLSSRRMAWGLTRVGNPLNPSYMHASHSPFPAKMDFFQRLENAYWELYHLIFYFNVLNGEETNALSRAFFGGDVPPVNEIVYNTSLIFANNHFTMDDAYPMVPNYIDIGGIHVKKPKPLPQDLQKFMDEAKDGVIYFTLGSLVRVSTMPEETLKAFKDAFAELSQRVLWKFEVEMKDAPPNVLVSNWFPQIDIFNHSNLRAFVSHGGNSGAIEAIHFGIPMIGIPLYHDQHRNIRSFVDKGVAVILDLHNLTKENILSAIRTIVNDNGYQERMKSLSAIYHDRPMSPLDTAVYWTEYVIKHKGAPHLRTVGSTLPWYQYLLLDVIAFILAVAATSIFVLTLIFKTLLKWITASFSSVKVKQS